MNFLLLTLAIVVIIFFVLGITFGIVGAVQHDESDLTSSAAFCVNFVLFFTVPYLLIQSMLFVFHEASVLFGYQDAPERVTVAIIQFAVACGIMLTLTQLTYTALYCVLMGVIMSLFVSGVVRLQNPSESSNTCLAVMNLLCAFVLLFTSSVGLRSQVDNVAPPMNSLFVWA